MKNDDLFKKLAEDIYSEMIDLIKNRTIGKICNHESIIFSKTIDKIFSSYALDNIKYKLKINKDNPNQLDFIGLDDYSICVIEKIGENIREINNANNTSN